VRKKFETEELDEEQRNSIAKNLATRWPSPIISFLKDNNNARLARVKREGSPSTHKMASASTSDGAPSGKPVASDQAASTSSAASASASAPASAPISVACPCLKNLSPVLISITWWNWKFVILYKPGIYIQRNMHAIYSWGARKRGCGSEARSSESRGGVLV